MNIYSYIGSSFCECHVHGYFVHVVRELLVFYSCRVGELCTIFLSSKFHFEILKYFSCHFYSWSCTCVFTLLNFYVACLYCDFMVVLHVFLLIICVMLVLSYLIILFHFFVTDNCDIALVINFLSVATSSSISLRLSED